MDFEAQQGDAGLRMDVWLHGRMPSLSRSRIQTLIKTGGVAVGGRAVRAHQKVLAGMVAAVTLPPAQPSGLAAENLALDVLYEDRDVIVVNKPARLVVHPAAGHDSGTLVNALLYRCRDLKGIGGERRPGIVHRLDRDTSGVMVVAKHDDAMNALTRQFRERTVQKKYLALVYGVPKPPEGRIETLIGRSGRDRKKMSARVSAGRVAVTRYRVLETFGPVSLVRVSPETGRTHQIRVHMAHIGHPVVGDPQYAGRNRPRQNYWRELFSGRAPGMAGQAPARQMLHAEQLAFAHPTSGQRVVFNAPLPSDMDSLLAALRGSR